MKLLKFGNGSIGMQLLQRCTITALVIFTEGFTIMPRTTSGINFLHPLNLITISKYVAITGILAIGMTFVIITGGIEFSVGSIVGLCGMIAWVLINEDLVNNAFGVTIYFQIWVIIII